MVTNRITPQTNLMRREAHPAISWTVNHNRFVVPLGLENLRTIMRIIAEHNDWSPQTIAAIERLFTSTFYSLTEMEVRQLFRRLPHQGNPRPEFGVGKPLSLPEANNCPDDESPDDGLEHDLTPDMCRICYYREQLIIVAQANSCEQGMLQQLVTLFEQTCAWLTIHHHLDKVFQTGEPEVSASHAHISISDSLKIPKLSSPNYQHYLHPWKKLKV